MKPITFRIFLWPLTRALCRVTVVSPDNVPGKGGALLVSNHISFVDMLLILAGTRRFVRFRPPLHVREHWAVKLFVRYFGVFCLSPESQLV
jgi:1-acyl-sn-glycerol-3-phosphate acyltransferase